MRNTSHPAIVRNTLGLIGFISIVAAAACSSAPFHSRHPASDDSLPAPPWKTSYACMKIIAPLGKNQTRWPWGFGHEVVRIGKEVWNIKVKLHDQAKHSDQTEFLFSDQDESISSDEQSILDALKKAKFNMLSRPLQAGASNPITPAMETFIRETLQKTNPSIVYDYVSDIFTSSPIRNYVYTENQIWVFELPDVSLDPDTAFQTQAGHWSGFISLNSITGGIESAWNLNRTPVVTSATSNLKADLSKLSLFKQTIQMKPLPASELPYAENELFLEFQTEMSDLFYAAQAAQEQGQALSPYLDAIHNSACSQDSSMAATIMSDQDDIFELK